MELMHFATVIVLYMSLFITLNSARPHPDAVTNVAPLSLTSYDTEPVTMQDISLNRERREYNSEGDGNVKPDDSTEESVQTDGEIPAVGVSDANADNQGDEHIEHEESDHSHN